MNMSSFSYAVNETLFQVFNHTVQKLQSSSRPSFDSRTCMVGFKLP